MRKYRQEHLNERVYMTRPWCGQIGAPVLEELKDVSHHQPKALGHWNFWLGFFLKEYPSSL